MQPEKIDEAAIPTAETFAKAEGLKAPASPAVEPEIEQRSDEWYAVRLGKITASKINDILMKPDKAGYQNYLSQLVCEQLTKRASVNYSSWSMDRGAEIEPQARAYYELAKDVAIAEVGFIDHPYLENCGCSPDGLIGDEGLVEIKCPEQTKHIKNLMKEKIDRNYLLQMQWQMACTGRLWCDYVSYNTYFPDEMQFYIQRVHRDSEEIIVIETAARSFLAQIEKLTQELQDKYQNII